MRITAIIVILLMNAELSLCLTPSHMTSYMPSLSLSQFFFCFFFCFFFPPACRPTPDDGVGH